MKRLNKKGFTLVELLAVIIILAVVVGITIPAVLTAVNDAQEKQFETASKNAADWFDRQYQAFLVGNDTLQPVDSNFRTACETAIGNATTAGTFTCVTNSTDASLIAATGLLPANIANVTVSFENGRSCVTLTAKDGGDYKITGKGIKSTAGGSCTGTTGVHN